MSRVVHNCCAPITLFLGDGWRHRAYFYFPSAPFIKKKKKKKKKKKNRKKKKKKKKELK